MYLLGMTRRNKQTNKKHDIMEEQVKAFNFVHGVSKMLFKINQFKSDHCKNHNNNNSQANLMNQNVTNCVF